MKTIYLREYPDEHNSTIYDTKLIKNLTSKAHKMNFRKMKIQEISELDSLDKLKLLRLQTLFR